jgi:GNAT superfamily N-acetyltransferase
MDAISVRLTTERDHDARAEIVHQAWEHGYAGIFSAAEIAGVFAGRLQMDGDWTHRRARPVATHVAETDGEVVGMVSTGMLVEGDAELAALYVLPEHQGKGVGLRLWEASVTHLRTLGLSRMEIWAMACAAATQFYEARGCRRFGAGNFWIADHTEPAIGYEFAL